jgi:uncharacterized cupin superfamily protein
VERIKIQSFDSARSDFQPAPINPAWIIAGSPVARALTLSRSPEGTLTSGLWDCTAGKFRWIYAADEIVHILEGEARVSDGTRTHALAPGQVIYFPRGLQAEWEVPKYIRKMFVLRTVPRPQREVVWAYGTRFIFQ